MHLQTLSVTTQSSTEWVAVQAALTELVNQLGQHVPSMSISSMDLEVDHVHDEEFYNEGTAFKVYYALRDSGLTETQVRDAILAMQNAGILFRERAVTTNDNGGRTATPAV